MRFRPWILLTAVWLGSGQGSARAVPVAGGYQPVEVTKAEVVAAAEFAVRARMEALRSAQSDASNRIRLLRIRSAGQQVVAGMNFRLLLEVEVGKTRQQVETVVWWQAWRSPDPFRLVSWQEIGQPT